MTKVLSFEDYDMSPDPGQLKAIYDSGFRGCRYDSSSHAALRATAERFYDAFPAAKGAGAGLVSLPFRACLTLDKEFGGYEPQTTGDCQRGDRLVLLGNGSLKRLDQIEVGDFVFTQHCRPRLVLDLVKKPYAGGPLITIMVEGYSEPLEATPDHQILVCVSHIERGWATSSVDRKWTPIAQLGTGDELVLSLGINKPQVLAKVISINKSIYSEDHVYCITIEEDHAFVSNGYVVKNCVSHGVRNAGMLDYCIDAMFGETTFEGRLATEHIYGWRGHSGQGADPSRLAMYVSKDGPGGFLPRKVYTGNGESVDLSKYNSRIGANWGSRGTPDWLNKIAAENPAAGVYQCQSLEEARDAIAWGFGLGVGSSLGFSSRRNEDGVAERSGSWAHEMAWTAADDTDWAHQKYDGMLFLTQNSWSDWNSGGTRHEQPVGSFWIRPKVAESMIRGGEAHIITSVRGYGRQLDYMREIAEKVKSLNT